LRAAERETSSATTEQPVAEYKRRHAGGIARVSDSAARVRYFARWVECSAPAVVSREIIQQILDSHATIGSSGARSVIDIGRAGSRVVPVEKVQQILNANPAIGDTVAEAAVHVGDAPGDSYKRVRGAEGGIGLEVLSRGVSQIHDRVDVSIIGDQHGGRNPSAQGVDAATDVGVVSEESVAVDIDGIALAEDHTIAVDGDDLVAACVRVAGFARDDPIAAAISGE